MKLKHVPFKAKPPEGYRYYFVVASNDNGSGGKVLGIVRRDPAGKWTADPRMLPPAPVAERAVVRTRTAAAALLVSAHRDALKAREGHLVSGTAVIR